MTTHRPTAGDGSAVDHHPRHTLDEVIHSPVRLSVVAALSGVEKADFRTLRDTIELSDSTLSKQLTVLEDAGYVEISKERAGRRTRTWVRLTPTGAPGVRAPRDAPRARLGDSGGERPVVKPDPVVTWVEGLEGASVRGVDHRFGLVTSPITDESQVHREIDLFASVASRPDSYTHQTLPTKA